MLGRSWQTSPDGSTGKSDAPAAISLALKSCSGGTLELHFYFCKAFGKAFTMSQEEGDATPTPSL